ncbi:MAG: polysaccharide biosynthesis tyrosine autokinase [Planctomycetota bacterium]|jgi:capsular exopolysaccharide synthesis family protein
MLDLRDYLRIVQRRWPIILVVAAAVVGASTMLIHEQPVRYEARAHLYIAEQPFIWGSRAGLAALTYPKGAHAELIRKREVMEMVIRNEALRDLYPTAEAPNTDLTVQVEALRRSIRVSVSEAIGQITIHYSTSLDAQRPVLIVNAVAEAYREYSKADQAKHIDETVRFIDRRIDTLKGEIEDRRIEMTRLPPEPTAFPFTLEEKTLLARIDGLSAQIAGTETRLDEVKGEIAYLNSVAAERNEPPAENGLDHQSRKIWNNIVLKEEQLDSMLRKYTSEWPPLKNIQKDIEYLREKHSRALEEEEKVGRTEALTQVIDAIRERVAEERLLKRKLLETLGSLEEARGEYRTHATRELTAEERKAHEAESLRRELTTEIEGLLSQIQSLKESRNDLTVTEKLISSPVKVDPATAAMVLSPSAGRSWLLLAVLGLVVGGAAAWLMEFLTTTIRTEHDVRRYVNLPLLGSVPRIEAEAERLLVGMTPQSPLSEVYHTMATLLEGHTVEGDVRSVMITSSNPKEGKSTVAANMAIALARGGSRVVLLDADLRKSVLHHFFGLENEMGLSGYLETAETRPIEEYLQPTVEEGLWILPAGPHERSPASMLKSERMWNLLQSLREQFDYVIVDVPPILIGADPLILASRMDGVILLVSAGETPKDSVSHSKRVIESARGKLLGAVLNKMTYRSRGYYYYYHGYYDYSYRYYTRTK